MIAPAHARLMAAYNIWQNASLYGAAATLSDAARKQDRGAFFKSIHGTLSHLLWGDRIWLSRFTGSPAPQAAIGDSSALMDDWDALCAEREKTDAHILAWTGAITQADLESEFTWRPASVDKTFKHPHWILVAHFFNHQTHHRGQVHAMLTAAGAKPADTDIPLMPGLDKVFAERL